MEGEEEIGGHHVVDWIAGDPVGADCAIVFDSAMVDARTPALTLGVRGIVQFGINVRTAPRDLHSGVYGGSVLNAVHVINALLREILPGPDGRLRDELRAGTAPPSDEERHSWASLPSGDDVLGEVGGRGVDERAGEVYYERNWSDCSLDVNGVMGGDAVQPRTIVPATAQAKVSMRLAPGQRSEQAWDTLQRLIRRAVPPGAEVDLIKHGAGEPAAFDPSTPALRLAASALERACGVPPALIRTGGSIAALAAFADRGIPTVLSGFALAADDIHAPNESFRLEALQLGERASRELYAALAGLE
jgi:acetylornithine deacetylase/succinyl-diaminopimelate desuccinylase-like protein